METPPAICVNTNQNGALGPGRVSVWIESETHSKGRLTEPLAQASKCRHIKRTLLSKDSNIRPVLSRNRGVEVIVFVMHMIVLIPCGYLSIKREIFLKYVKQINKKMMQNLKCFW